MKLARLATFASLTALTVGSALAAQALRAPAAAVRAPVPTSARPAVRTLPATQALFDGYVRDDKMPGIVAAYGIGDAPTMFPAAGRIADDPAAAPAGPDSLWRIYSMTKPITGMAAMILIEQGKIGLDDPVAKYIPAFASMKVLTSPDTSLESVPARTPITIRHLLTHSGGLGYNIIVKGPLLKQYEQRGILPAQVNMAVEAQMRRVRPGSLAEFADRVAALPLIAEPGTKWSYSIGLDVMGRVIEVASGMSFEAFVQQRLFDPLKMRSTFWTVPRGEVGRLATNYVFTGDARAPLDTAAGSVWLQPPSFPYGGAGLVSSARDYDRFLHMLQNYGTLDGVRIMKRETAQLAMSNLLPAGVTFRGIGGGTGGTTAAAPLGFGAGGSVYLADGPLGVPSKGTYGWGGAAGTIAYVDAGRGVRGTIMVNYFPSERWPTRAETVAALARDMAGSPR
jgi:CubicO group peptidase (beta-lactamase class C family)